MEGGNEQERHLSIRESSIFRGQNREGNHKTRRQTRANTRTSSTQIAVSKMMGGRGVLLRIMSDGRSAVCAAGGDGELTLVALLVLALVLVSGFSAGSSTGVDGPMSTGDVGELLAFVTILIPAIGRVGVGARSGIDCVGVDGSCGSV